MLFSHSGSEQRRREFLKTAGLAVAASGMVGASTAPASADSAPTDESAKLAGQLFHSLTEKQKKVICFDWNHTTSEHGVLRTHVDANWQITDHKVTSNFYTRDQQDMIEAIFWGLYNPEWQPRIRKQLQDDSGGYGREHSIALFGNPDNGPFELVLTGRHLTIRCDGNTTPHTAFGGPIFYGHAAGGFNEEPDHPGNVFWSQAVKANQLYGMLDGRQRKLALVPESPDEQAIHFRANGEFPGIPVSELSADQKQHLQGVLKALVDPYRQQDQLETMTCLEAMGGLDRCALSFFESDDVGEDGIWDTWRLEGPAFVWHYRGDPHVHVWVNVADDASVKITTPG